MKRITYQLTEEEVAIIKQHRESEKREKELLVAVKPEEVVSIKKNDVTGVWQVKPLGTARFHNIPADKGLQILNEINNRHQKWRGYVQPAIIANEIIAKVLSE